MPSSDLCDAVEAAVDAFWKQNYMPPTLRDIMSEIDSNSTSMVSKALSELESAGKLKLGGDRYTARRAIPFWVMRAIAGES